MGGPQTSPSKKRSPGSPRDDEDEDEPLSVRRLKLATPSKTNDDELAAQTKTAAYVSTTFLNLKELQR